MSGQFCFFYKYIQRINEPQYCVNKEKPCGKQAKVRTKQMPEEPYAKALVFNFVWQEKDIKQTNCLKVLASLPPHIFLSQIFQASFDIKLAYKLNCIVGFTGAHYLIFIRSRIDGTSTRMWTLYNDDDAPKRFPDFPEMARFFVQSNMVPTMVVFEGFPYTDKTIDQTKTYIQQHDEDWLMLYTYAQELESEVDGLMENSEFMKQQAELMESFGKDQQPQASKKPV